MSQSTIPHSVDSPRLNQFKNIITQLAKNHDLIQIPLLMNDLHGFRATWVVLSSFISHDRKPRGLTGLTGRSNMRNCSGTVGFRKTVLNRTGKQLTSRSSRENAKAAKAMSILRVDWWTERSFGRTFLDIRWQLLRNYNLLQVWVEDLFPVSIH